MLRWAYSLLLVVLMASPAWAGYDEGMAAYKRGDYATAMREWRPLAEQGDAEAQSNLGFMYQHGQGVSQDYAEATRWFRKAAEQGYDRGQYNLGDMYSRGRGVPQDYVLAHMWFNLAATQGHKNAATNRDRVAEHMTPADISKAQRLAREWWAKHGKK